MATVADLISYMMPIQASWAGLHSLGWAAACSAEASPELPPSAYRRLCRVTGRICPPVTTPIHCMHLPPCVLPGQATASKWLINFGFTCE